MSRKPVILIGGIPVIGKTMLAFALAARMRCGALSTDTVRRIIRGVTTAKQFPGAHFFVGQRANLYLSKTPVHTILQHYHDESRDVFKALRPLINDFEPAKEYGFIIEGVAIVPRLVAAMRASHRKSIFLVAKTKNEIEKNLYRRGLWAATKSLQKKELEYLWAMNEEIKQEAKRFGFPVISARPYRTLLRRVLRELA